MDEPWDAVVMTRGGDPAYWQVTFGQGYGLLTFRADEEAELISSSISPGSASTGPGSLSGAGSMMRRPARARRPWSSPRLRRAPHAECDGRAFTEREGPAGSGSLIVERVVDRLAGASCAFCAFRAFGRAFSAASALRAGRLRNGKEKVYGSIP